MDLYKEIMMKENTSEWVRDACHNQLLHENDNSVIESEIKKYETKIKELKDRKKGKNYDKNKVNELLTKWYDVYRSSRRDTAEDYLVVNWINKSILPEIRATGCKDLDAKAILSKFRSGRISVE